MRHIVPILLMSFFTTLPHAFAENSLPTKGDLDEFNQGCKDPTKTGSCTSGAADLQQLWNGANASPFKPDLSGSDEEIKTKADSVANDIQKTLSTAQACCKGDANGCPLNTDASQGQQDVTQALNTTNNPANGLAANGNAFGGLGLTDTSKKSQQFQTDAQKANAGYAGQCQAQGYECSYESGKALSALPKADDAAACGTNCKAAHQQLQKLQKECQSIDKDPSQQAAVQSQQDAQAAAASGKAASDSSGTSSASTSTPTKTAASAGKSGSSGDPMSSLLQGLAQGAAAAMAAQQPATTPTTAAATTPSTSCTGATVSANCPATAATQVASWNKGGSSVGQSNYATQSVNGKTNVGNPADNLNGAGQTQFGGGQAAAASAPAVANGGGQMLGNTGGGGNSGATLGAAVAAAANYGGPGRNTDIERGYMSGGGYTQMAASMNTNTGGNGGWSGYGGRGPASTENFDLKAFLPGGKSDPTRKLAGGNASSAQIQSKEVNIWNRISDHIRARCSQGLLRDCIP